MIALTLDQLLEALQSIKNVRPDYGDLPVVFEAGNSFGSAKAPKPIYNVGANQNFVYLWGDDE